MSNNALSNLSWQWLLDVIPWGQALHDLVNGSQRDERIQRIMTSMVKLWQEFSFCYHATKKNRKESSSTFLDSVWDYFLRNSSHCLPKNFIGLEKNTLRKKQLFIFDYWQIYSRIRLLRIHSLRILCIDHCKRAKAKQ